MTRTMTGTLYGLGIGPGDPELITVKALCLLKAAPVLAYPAPESGDSLARAIVAGYLPGGQTEIVLRMPMRSEEHTSELQSLMRISYAVFCLKKKKTKHTEHVRHNSRGQNTLEPKPRTTQRQRYTVNSEACPLTNI